MPRPRLAATLAALALAASVAQVRAEPPPDPDADDQGDFWGSVLEPHGVEVAILIDNGRQEVLLAHQAGDGRGDPRFRGRHLREAAAIASHVRSLDPRAPGLDFLLGTIADEAGRAAAAERHLGDYVARVEPGSLRTEALLRLGRIALIRRDPRAAMVHLRQALAEQRNRGERAHAVMLLAQALDDDGDLDGAIELLAAATLASVQTAGEPEENAIWLALIAAYDRDEQLTAALELTERLKTVLQSDYTMRIATALDEYAPSPIAAAWYLRAMAFETADQLGPARAAWTTYLGLAPSSRYRPRAQAHVDAIDATLAARRTIPAPPRRRPGARP